MSFHGRNWAKIGKKLLQAGRHAAGPTSWSDHGQRARSVFEPERRIGQCRASRRRRSGSWSGTSVDGKPGLCISYRGLIRRSFYPALWQNIGSHLNGCYTDGNAPCTRIIAPPEPFPSAS